jgi:hypothetical protein
MIRQRVGKEVSKTPGNVLFLLRTYNDIDHIAPVIWKAANMGQKPFLLFVDGDYRDDYRIRCVIAAGAETLWCESIRWYHQRIRRWLVLRWLRRVVDRLVAHTLGRKFLLRHKVAVLASEWSGAFGREMAEYFLRPAHSLGLRCVSLPHGYFIWTNDRINMYEVNLWQREKTRPDFSTRNIFSTYVVQNSEAKRFNIDRGVSSDNVRVLGSARFCPEWFETNTRLITDGCPELPKDDVFRVLFFVPDWTYNVDRQACISLLEQLARIDQVLLVVKANTRGTSALNLEERIHLKDKANIEFADLSNHSPCLIRQADAIINFASSIGLEALLQGKPVCNPMFLNSNSTIFDGSGVVIDAENLDEVLNFVESVKGGQYQQIAPEIWSNFYRQYILGGSKNEDVLSDYLRLLMFQNTLSGPISPQLNF